MPRQTITRTVRLSPEVDRELQQLAKQERVSVNYLVASSLKRLTEWDILAEKFGFVAVPGFLHARIFSLEHTFDGRAHTIIVKHGLGAKGSVFNEEFLTGIFKGLLNLDPESERTEDQVVIRLKIPRETHKPGWSETYGRQYSERLAQQETPFSYGG